MGYPAYIGTNLADSTNWTFHADIDDTQAHSLLVDQKVWKSFIVNVGVGGAVWMEKDFGSAVTPESIAIHGHDLPNTAVVVVKAGAAPAPTATQGTFTWRDRDMILTGLTGNFRYWRIEITVAQGTYDVGQIVFGDRVLISEGHEYNYDAYDERKTTELESPGGIDLSDVLSDGYVFTAEFRVQDATATELATLDALVKGNIPFTFQPNSNEAAVYYGFKEWDQPRRFARVQRNHLPFKFKEAPLADVIL